MSSNVDLHPLVEAINRNRTRLADLTAIQKDPKDPRNSGQAAVALSMDVRFVELKIELFDVLFNMFRHSE
jgi:hypothetical protein